MVKIKHNLSSVFLVILFTVFHSMTLPTLPITVFAVFNLRILNTVRVTSALLGAGVLVDDSPGDGRHARDARLGEQPFILLELAVSFVWSNVGLGGSQVPVPSSDDIAILMGILQITSLKSINLSFQIGKSVGNLRSSANKVSKLLPCVYICNSLFASHFL